MPFPDDISEKKIIIYFCYQQRQNKKNNLEDFSSINAAGKIAMKLRPR